MTRDINCPVCGTLIEAPGPAGGRARDYCTRDCRAIAQAFRDVSRCAVWARRQAQRAGDTSKATRIARAVEAMHREGCIEWSAQEEP